MVPPDLDLDHRVRLAAFAFLSDQTRLRGEVLPYALLHEGFTLDGHRVPLLGPQGIFKPAVLPEIPLSITTAPVVEGKARPYEDEVDRGIPVTGTTLACDARCSFERRSSTSTA
jgi:hypothetical protein